MNRDERFEVWIADWLGEGPELAPDMTVSAAIDHARRHPRRRLSRASLRRGVMRQLGISDTTPGASRMPIGLVAAAALVVVVGAAALAGGWLWRGSDDRSGAVAPLETATPAAPTQVSGTASCEVTDPGSRSTIDAVVVSIDRVETCTLSMSDPRAGGDLVLTLRHEAFDDGSATITGTGRLTTGDGAWTGGVNGYSGQPQPLRIAWSAIGSGAYAGLRYEAWIARAADDGEITVTGSIVPSDALTGVGTLLLSYLSGDLEVPAVDGVTPLREIRFSVETSTGDDRLDGFGTLTWNEDARADGGAESWGTISIGPASARWTGDVVGTRDADQSSVVTGTLAGSGPMRGWKLQLTLTSAHGMAFNLVTQLVAPSASPGS